MDQDSAHMVAASKVPMLKPGEFEIWRMRIKQYIKMMDYALWEVIENDATLPKTQVVDGRNKADLDTMSIDDLYNNVKLILLIEFLLLALKLMLFDNLSDAVICAFLASQPNSPQHVYEDLEQILLDDIGEMDLRWKMDMLTTRAKREYKALRNQDTKHKESTIRSVHVETPTLTALVSCDGLGGYDWSDKTEEGPNYALMAYTSLITNSNKSELMVLAYKTSLKLVEERLEFFKKNEFIYLEDIKVLKVEIQMKDIAIKELRRKLEVAQKEKDGIQLTVEKLENASKSLNKLIVRLLTTARKDEFAVKPVVENKSSKEETKAVRKNTDAPIIEEWVSDDAEKNVTQPKIVKKIVKPNIVKKEFVKPRQQEKTASKTVMKVEHNRQNTHRHKGNQRNRNNMMSQKLGSNFEMFNKSCYTIKTLMEDMFRLDKTPKERKSQENVPLKLDETSGIIKSFITRIENLVDHKVKVIRCDNETEFKHREMNQFCEMKGILRQFSVARTPQQNGVDERRNKILIEAARTMLADSKSTITFWAEAVNTACYVQNRVLVVKPHNKTPYELFHGRTPTLSFMRPFGCPVTILNTKDYLGTQSNGFAGTKASDNVGQARKETELSSTVNAASTNENNELRFEANMPALEDVSILNFSNDDEDDDIEELLQFKLQEVWTLVDLPNGKRAISTKWVFRNKKDKRGIMIRNKARLVAQGDTREEEIDYDEVIAPIARIEANRLFLAYAPFKDFMVYQMDVKSAFLYGKIEEEVYVCQLPRFEDLNFPDRVYKVEKVLYGLHQAPRSWYETLSTYLLDNGFQRGKIDKTLFIKSHKGDILLVQVYVDDIIFSLTRNELSNAFGRLMHKKFQMSSIGKFTFFLGLQVKQKNDGIFISQDKYIAEIIKKFRFIEVKNASTPMETQKPLLKDEDKEEVDVHMYRSMIGSLMYLTSSKPDIMFAVCACARCQVNLKVSHLYVVKMIFRIGVNTAGSKLMLLDVSTAMAKTINGESQIHAQVDGKEIVITESSVMRDLRLADEEGVDCLLNSNIFENLDLICMIKNLDKSSGTFLIVELIISITYMIIGNPRKKIDEDEE
nr:putative ribonuclease H-like domain-containing protein [Tanacetum cinerariifolium]